MRKTVLVTGGAGFIGSYVTDELISNGYSVRVLDNLSSLTHRPAQRRPPFLNAAAEYVFGDVQDSETVKRSLKGVEAVCHLAAVVGAGQSMMDVRSFTAANTLGTAVLM